MKTIILLNKSDLEQKTTEEDLNKLTDSKVFSISAKENTGLEELSDYIVQMFTDGKIDYNDEIFISNERNINSVIRN